MGQWKELMYESERRGHAARERFVCGECLCDDALAEFVSDHAVRNECEFCGTKRDTPFAASLGDVIEYMAGCINEVYTDPADELPYETAEGGWQGEVFNGFELMAEIDFGCDSEELFNEIASALCDQEWCRDDYFSLEPSERLRYGWDAFKQAVKHARRFTFWSIGDDKSEYDPDYMPVGGMLATIAGCIRDAELVKVVPNGKLIWRVRVHDPTKTLREDHELSPPPGDMALQANRMSPAGIVMFYGAEDFETACAETITRTVNTDKFVTGGAFRTLRDLRILDLVDLPKMPGFFQQGTSDFRDTLRFLRRFAIELAAPVVRDGREHVEYVPTQAFTEYVRHEMKLYDGATVDGIRYRSAVNGEPCFVLFCTQDECIANPRGYRKPELWLELDVGSIRTENAADMIKSLPKSTPAIQEGAGKP